MKNRKTVAIATSLTLGLCFWALNEKDIIDNESKTPAIAQIGQNLHKPTDSTNNSHSKVHENHDDQCQHNHDHTSAHTSDQLSASTTKLSAPVVVSKDVENKLKNMSLIQAGDLIDISLSDTLNATLKVTLSRDFGDNRYEISGEIEGQEGTFRIGSVHDVISGRVNLDDLHIYQIQANDQAALVSKQITKAHYSCVGFHPPERAKAHSGSQKFEVDKIDLDDLVFSASGIPLLDSKPGITDNVLFLDFDDFTYQGTAFNDSGIFDGDNFAAYEGSTEQIVAIWENVRDFFRAFDVNVTTDPTKFTGTDLAQSLAVASNGVRCVITATDSDGSLATSISGQAADIPAWGQNEVCWVWTSSTIDTNRIAHVISHEVGHTLDLYHWGKRSTSETYYPGHDDGETSWSPIMGGGWDANIFHWSDGNYTDSTNQGIELRDRTEQDDFDRITNFLPFSTDDHANFTAGVDDVTLVGATVHDSEDESTYTGVIGSNSDIDTFTFTTGEAFDIDIMSDKHQSSLDIIAVLYDSTGTEITRSDLDNNLNAYIQHDPSASSTFYLTVTGGDETIDTGYTDYGSIGAYSINLVTSSRSSIVEWNMDVDPGFTLTAGAGDYAWQWGAATGLNGNPGSGETGSNILAYNLRGDYNNFMTAEYATTPAIDCSKYTNVQLNFKRWLGVEANGLSSTDYARIEVSTDNATWNTIWTNLNAVHNENSWSDLKYDISKYADAQETVYIRWVMGSSDSTQEYHGWSIDDIVISGSRQPIIYAANMNNDPNWTLSTGNGDFKWEWGTPTGNNGTPANAATDTNIMAYNLNGQYDNDMLAEYAVTPAIDCTFSKNIELNFKRWLGVNSSPMDNASIEVSSDNITWDSVWANSATNIDDSEWQDITVDISAYADNKATVYIRWTMGATDSSLTNSGWAIDDVYVLGIPGLSGAPIVHEINYSVSGDGTVDGYSQQFMEPGDNALTVTAIANPGSYFAGWSDGTETASRTDLNIQADLDVTALFTTSELYTLTVNKGSGGGEQPELNTITITADTAPPGFSFEKWFSFDGVPFDDETSETTTILMPSYSTTVIALYDENDAYGITVINGVGDTSVIEGLTATITAQERDNEAFTGWISSAPVAFANANEISTSFTMIGESVILTATYGPLPNREPEANADTTISLSGQTITINVLGNDTDPDGNSLTITSVTQDPDGGLVSIDGGTSLLFTAPNENGIYSFTYDVQDNDPMTPLTTTGNVTVTVAEIIVPGLRRSIEASSVDNGLYGTLTEFTNNPIIYTTYFDPIKDPDSLKPRTITVKPLETVSAKTGPQSSVDVNFKKPIKLYDLKVNKAEYKLGQSVSDLFSLQENLSLNVFVKTKEDLVSIDDELDYDFIMTPPQITAVKDNLDALKYTIATAEIFVVEGLFFGSKAPKIWLEYINAKGQTKQVKCRVLKPYTFPDINSKPERSVMDSNTGESKMSIIAPKKWPKDFVHGTHPLVIDNGIGFNYINIKTQD